MNKTKIEIFKSGDYGDHESRKWSKKETQELVSNYDTSYRQAPIILGHNGLFDGEKPAFGWVNSLSINDKDVVVADVEYSDELQDMVSKQMYKNVSIEATKAVDKFDKKGKKGAYLLAVAFLGGSQPAVQGLQAVSFSTDMKEYVDTFEMPISTQGEEMPKPTDEPNVQLSAENEALKEKVAKFEAQEVERLETKRQEDISKFVSENLKKITPANKESYESFMLSLSDDQAQSFKKIVEKMPELEIFQELSDQENKDPSVANDDKFAKQAKEDFAILSEE